MKSIIDYINLKDYNVFFKTFGSIKFQLDESSIELLDDNAKQMISEGYYITLDNIITEMSNNAQRYRYRRNPKERGNRVIWTSKDGDVLKIGDHASQRQDRTIEQGGDGEHISTKEIIDMFIYTWADIMDMYYDGYLKHTQDLKSFVTLCKCYLRGSENNLHCSGARPQNKYLWSAWMIEENYDTQKIDITIRTIFRGEFFKHGKVQERIIIASNGYVKQKLPTNINY